MANIVILPKYFIDKIGLHMSMYRTDWTVIPSYRDIENQYVEVDKTDVWYQEQLIDMIIQSAEKHIKNLDDIIIIQNDRKYINYKNARIDTILQTRDLWLQGNNIFAIESDTLCVDEVDVFGRYDKMVMFSKNFNHESIFNAGVKYFPQEMPKEVWDTQTIIDVLDWPWTHGDEQQFWNKMYYKQFDTEQQGVEYFNKNVVDGKYNWFKEHSSSKDTASIIHYFSSRGMKQTFNDVKDDFYNELNSGEENINYRKKRENPIDNPNLLGLQIVEINPTELCNRTCSFCPRHNAEVYPNRNLHMDDTTIQNIIDSLTKAEFKGEIHVTGFGEPFLHKTILKMLKSFSTSFFTETITNGDMIKDGKYNIEEVFDTGLHMLSVDCYDGIAQVKYFEELLKPYEGRYRIRKHFDTGEDKWNLIPEYNFNNRGGLLDEGTHKLVENQCYLPFYKSLIDWNGEVRLCCNDWSRHQKAFGNVNETDYAEIWDSDEFRSVREKLSLGKRQDLKACQKCDVNGLAKGRESFDKWSEHYASL